MISRFDKSCAASLLKREFAEHIQNAEYPAACEALLDFTRRFSNPDFHKAFGMIYLLIAQDSDDREYLNLAVREFMTYLNDHPDCYEAYRNIVAAMLLLHDAKQLISWSELVKARGMDFSLMLEDIAAAGLDMVNEECQYDLALMFEPGEFGAIDITRADAPNERGDSDIDDVPYVERVQKTAKVIPFRGGEHTVPSAKYDGDLPDADADGQPLDFESALDIIKEIIDGDLPDEFDASELTGEEVGVRLALRRAEQYAEQYRFDEALDELGKITSDDADIYYGAECVRAYIYLSKGNVQKAHTAIKRALSVNAGGALAGTVLCEIYRAQKRTGKIPAALKAIDYKDFIDADHVYKAAWLAIDYCDPLDALDLLQKYDEEYNIADVQLLYAQLMYNYGDKDRAVGMFRDMASVMYDDFSAQIYYIMAKNGYPMMPVDDGAPHGILSALVDGFIEAVLGGKLDANDEMFDLAVEAFLTLEFDSDRATTVRMYAALRALCDMPSMREKLDAALVSPYVEQSVKAVILAKKLARGERTFLAERDLCPISDDTLPQLGSDAPAWAAIGYAFTAVRNNGEVYEFIKLADALMRERARIGGLDDRDIAQYLIRNTRSQNAKRSGEKNLAFALGYSYKADATNAYRAACAVLDGVLRKKTK